MTKEEFGQYNLPDTPGVYVFKKAKEILYIGKATSLRDRVRSYFSADVIHTRGPLIVDMVQLADDLEVIETDSVLEALILEASLIKKHQPYHNTKEKDNKSFTYIVITKEDFPRVVAVRGRNIEQLFPHEDRKYTFGPFPHGGVLKEALKIIRKIFPYRDKCVPFESLSLEKREKARPCFNSQIGLCSGVCMGDITKEEYNRMIQNLKLFFEGKKIELLRNLEKEMKEYARQKEFEKAEKVKQRIYTLTHIQDISLLKKDINDVSISTDQDGVVSARIEAYDIAHMSGGNMVGAMVVIEDGEIKNSDYRKFKIRSVKGANDIACLKEVLRRRLKHAEWPLPALIVVDGAEAQKSTAEQILIEHNLSIPVVAVVKNDAHKADRILGDATFVTAHESSILLANSEAHRFAIGYHKKLRGKNLFK